MDTKSHEEQSAYLTVSLGYKTLSRLRCLWTYTTGALTLIGSIRAVLGGGGGRNEDP